MTESLASTHEAFRFPDGESLRRKIELLGVDIPWSEDVSPLLAPMEVGGRSIPNRLAVHPMEGADSEPGGAPGELTLRRYQRFAAGGSGLIWFEAVTVAPEGRSNPRQLILDETTLEGFKVLVDKTRRAAKESMGHDPLLLVQLTHSGRYSRPGDKPTPIIARHNPIFDLRQGLGHDYPLITDDELDRLEERFVHAASLARQAGFDGVDIKACHGYLAAELLCAFNRENSKYGGAFENRTRFLLEVMEAIGSREPSLMVCARINGYDGVPHPHGVGADPDHPERENLSEVLALASALHSLGNPLLNLSLGIPCYNPHLGRPFNTNTKGTPLPAEHPLKGVARLLRITGEVQKSVPGMPLVGTGYSWLRHYFPHVGAAVLAQGRAGLIGVGRCAFAYPDFAKDLKNCGTLDPEKICIACSACTQIMRDGGSAGCAVRDKEIYLPIYKQGRKQAAKGSD